MKELLVAIDLEMNRPSARIIQIGAVLGNVGTGKVLARFDVKVNPLETLDPRIIELTGIRQIEVDTACTLARAYKRLADWLAPHAAERALNPLTWGGGDSDTLREQLGLQDERWLFGRRWIDVKTLYVAWRMAQGKDIQGGLAKAMTQLGLAFSGRKHNRDARCREYLPDVLRTACTVPGPPEAGHALSSSLIHQSGLAYPP